MDKKILRNYRRFKDYTLKLSMICLVLAIVCLFLFYRQLWVAGILLVASISAYGHHAYLKMVLHYYDKKDHERYGD